MQIIEAITFIKFISQGRVGTITQNSNRFLPIENFEVNGNVRIEVGSHNDIDLLHIKNCTFKGFVLFEGYSRIQAIMFESCTFEKICHLDKLSTPIVIKDCVFAQNLTVNSISQGTKHLEILETVSNSTITITGVFANLLRLKNINTSDRPQGEIAFEHLKVKEIQAEEIYCSRISISKQSSLDNEANFRKINSQSFIVNAAEIGLKFRLISSTIANLSFDNLSGNRDIEISESSITENLSLALHMLSRTTIFQCTFIKQLQIWGINNRKETFLNIEKVGLEKLYFNKVYNEGIITLRELTIKDKGKLAIHSSNLGRTDFILCDFSKAILEFENSKIADAFLSETDFPKMVHIDEVINHAQAQLAFGQLHTAFQKQGDTVRSLEYQSREIESHYRKLKWFIARRKPYVNFTWLNLWLNKISNDFGRKWIRALIFSIVVGVLFFYFLVLSTIDYCFGFPIAFDLSLINAFFKFMNPLRFFETEALFQNRLTLTIFSYFLDFSGRIFIAFGFYQTIQAFRRFGRK